MDAPPVQFVRTSDGYDIAYRVTGSGMPLVFIPPQLSDIQMIWQLYPEWLEGLSQRFRLVQYDCRGEGFSTRGLPDDHDPAAFVRDIEAVTDRLQLERFFIWGWAARSHYAIRYAVAHPDRVAGLMLHTCSVSDAAWRGTFFNALPLDDWDTFLYAMAPRDISPEEHRQWVEAFRASMTREDWDAQLRSNQGSDVQAELEALRVPTLVLHSRDFQRLSPSETMKVAALIPGARFLLLDGGFATSSYLYGDAAQGLAAIDTFLASLPSPTETLSRPALPDTLSERELEVLRLLAQGKSNPEIAKELFITRNTVQNHVSNILIKLNLQNRAQAAVYAQQHGIV